MTPSGGNDEAIERVARAIYRAIHLANWRGPKSEWSDRDRGEMFVLARAAIEAYESVHKGQP